MSYESSVLNTRYRLDRKVGQGGFAQVFLATDLLLKRRVAIKVLNADLTADPDFLARFEREAQAIAALDHPNILAVYDYGQAHDTAYLVMPYVEGGTLYDRLREQRTLGLPETGEYLRQAAAGGLSGANGAPACVGSSGAGPRAGPGGGATPSMAAAKACTNSPAVWKRSAGCFASARSTTPCRAAGAWPCVRSSSEGTGPITWP